MLLLSPIAYRFSELEGYLNIPNRGLRHLEELYVENLRSTLDYWLNFGNSPKINSPVKWKTIIEITKTKFSFEIAKQMEQFLQREDIHKHYMKNLSGIAPLLSLFL